VIYHYISTVLSMYVLHVGSWFYIGLLCAIKWWCCCRSCLRSQGLT